MDTLISLSGHLGTDIDVRAGAEYTYSHFRVASTRRVRRGDEWVDADTTWMRVQTSGLLARNVATSLHKGDPVVIVGRLRTSIWIDSSGVRHDSLFVEATHVGHDLSLGRTAFIRTPRLSPVPRVDHGQGPATERVGDMRVVGEVRTGSGAMPDDEVPDDEVPDDDVPDDDGAYAEAPVRPQEADGRDGEAEPVAVLA